MPDYGIFFLIIFVCVLTLTEISLFQKCSKVHKINHRQMFYKNRTSVDGSG